MELEMRASHASLIFTLALLGTGSGAAGQTFSALGRAVPYPVSPVPFGPGELQQYRVTWGVFGSVGKGTLEVVGVDTMHGHPSYHLQFRVRGGVAFLKVNDNTQSWLDVATLASRRFDQDVDEVNYERHRIIDIFPEEMRWARQNSEETGELMSAEPLDDVSFLYFVRTLPLVVGETYSFNRYWRDRGNPVVVKVLRKDSVKLDGVTVPTIVVQPIIQTKGAFSEDGEAEVHFSDDDRRLIVYLKASMAIGSLRMYLERYTPGTQLRQEAGPGGSGS
jgi:hypothetical protein